MIEARKANILVYDVGSTYTKTAAFHLDGDNLQYLANGQSPTTLEDIMIGVNEGHRQLEEKGITVDPAAKTYATCSAAGGLRMVALGYMPQVTAKAAKEVAMTAGARVMEVISSDEALEYRAEILHEIQPDIILLAGGTDGGDQTSALENVELLTRIKTKAKVIIACNIEVQAQAQFELESHGIDCVRVPNIMPMIHELNVKPAREAIHTVFIKQLTNAKGLDKLSSGLTDPKVIPTPGAVLLASELLARGTYEQKGVDGVLLIDLGGATTDVHSALQKLEELKAEERGLIISNDKQFSYRTVEGNLGMRVSATGIVETVGPRRIIDKLPAGAPLCELEEVWDYARKLEDDTKLLPESDKKRMLDEALACCAITVALRRHAGHFIVEPDPVMGLAAGSIVGRDLRMVEFVLAVGGIFTYAGPEERERILTAAFADPGISLLPLNPKFYYDDDYILYALGVLSQHFPDAVFSFMKRKFSI